nr:hypothetical protein CFP56_23885 [Quercus suber]
MNDADDVDDVGGDKQPGTVYTVVRLRLGDKTMVVLLVSDGRQAAVRRQRLPLAGPTVSANSNDGHRTMDRMHARQNSALASAA